jgi:hypothetical protein
MNSPFKRMIWFMNYGSRWVRVRQQTIESPSWDHSWSTVFLRPQSCQINLDRWAWYQSACLVIGLFYDAAWLYWGYAWSNKVLRRIFGPKKENVTGRKKYIKRSFVIRTKNNIMMIKSRKMRWVGNVARMVEMKIHIKQGFSTFSRPGAIFTLAYLLAAASCSWQCSTATDSFICIIFRFGVWAKE